MEEEHDGIERNEREGCLDSQLDWNLTRMLRTMKNIEFYRVFDRNRPIKTIDGYDKRSTMDRFRKCRICPIFDEGLWSLLR